MAQESAGTGNAGSWPALTEQLRRAKVTHGTTFESFIQANQDVDLLRPEEHDGDGVGYPLWLRVYWRKAHPEQPNSAAGPASDYPDALERIYEWMKLNQDLSPNAETWMSVAKGTSKGARHGD